MYFSVLFDLEEAFDLVPREFICFAFRRKVVLEYLTKSWCSSRVTGMVVLTEVVRDGLLM